jgi:hypothetical protein
MKYRSEWEWELEMKRRGYTQGEDNRGIYYKDKIGFKRPFSGRSSASYQT